MSFHRGGAGHTWPGMDPQHPGSGIPGRHRVLLAGAGAAGGFREAPARRREGWWTSGVHRHEAHGPGDVVQHRVPGAAGPWTGHRERAVLRLVPAPVARA